MNTAVLVGRMASDPDIRKANNGTKMCYFRIAVNRNYKNAEGNYDADFLPIVCWGIRADFVEKYIRKGDRVAVEGAIRTRSYDGQDGQKRYVTEIVADNVEGLSPRKDTDNAKDDGFTEIEDDNLPF